MNDREPVPLRDALDEIGREFGLAAVDAVARVAELWRAAAGDALAAHSNVASVRDGVCVITVDDPAWATPARYLETAIVTAANAHLGPGVVTSVQVRIRPR